MNGRYAGRGPAPNPPGHASVDEIDVARHLHAGRNAIGVIVHHVGVPCFPRVLGRAGLILDLEAGADHVTTDASWKAADGWWNPTRVRLTPMREFVEELDGRKEPVGWATAGFDAATWRAVAEIGPEGTKPWTAPELRDIPMPAHADAFPERVLFIASCGGEVPPRMDAARVLAAAPEREERVTQPERWIRGAVPVAAGKDGVVIGIDFGREVAGFPELSVDAEAEGVVIDLGYGEAIDKDRHVSVLRQDNPDCDRMILRHGEQTLRVFHHRAFRYLVLAVRGGTVRIKSLKVVESGYPVEPRGAFRCSDPMLTSLWEVGRRTVQLCMDQGYMDCPWRERGQYIGDGLAEGPVARYAFGDTKLMRRFLRQASLCQPADGLLEPAYPSDWTKWHGERGPHRIPGYGALWVVMLGDYWRATGDLALVRSVADVMDRQIRWFERFRGKDKGLLKSAPEWNFIDWAPLDPRSALASLNLQYLMALRAAAVLDDAMGRTSERSSEAICLAAAFQAAHWDEARGLFRDAEGVVSMHTNTLALLALVDDPKVADRIVKGMAAPGVVPIGSPYFDGFLIRALARHGRHADALELIRARFGPMLTAGATTLWEAHQAEWSLCHGWSCEPTAFLPREILGVSYDAPRKLLRFAPRLAGLQSAEGVAPLSCGPVSVKLASAAGGFTARLEAPAGVAIEADFAAPEGATLTVDGSATPLRPEGSRIVTRLPGGAHTFTLKMP